jgi:hypothetical protein
MHSQAFLAGAISACSTLFLLWGNQLGDPSMLIALGGATIIYTVFYDIFTRQTTTKIIMMPAIIVFLGSLIASFGGSMQVTFYGVLFVLLISNGLSALSEIVEQRGVRASDSVNLFVWRFFWLATTGTVLALMVSSIRGKSDLLLITLQKAWAYLPWVLITMLFVFLGIGLKLYAKKNNAVSLVILLTSVQLFMAYPITLLGDLLRPGIFGDVPSEASIWAIRIVGAGVMVWGIFLVTKKIHDK